MSSYIDIIRSNEAAAQKKHEWRSETFSKEITCCYCGSPLKKKSKGRWTGHKCANCRAVAHKECCVFVEKHCPLPDVFGGGSSNRVNGPKSAQTLRAKTLKNTMCVSNTAEPVFLPTNGPSDPTKVPSLNPSFGQGQGKSKGKGAQAPSAPAPVPVPVPPVTVPTAMPPVVTPIKTKKSSKRTKNIKTNGGGGGNSGDAVVNSSTASTVVTNNMSTTATGITVREPPNTVSPFKTKRIPSSSSSNNNDNNGSSSSGGGGSSSSRSSCSNSNNSDGSNVNVNVSTNISGKDTSRSRSRSISSSAHGLPANWNMRFDKKTHKYYYSDKEKRRTVWIPPQDVLDEVALPPKWRVDIEEETNRMVYVDTVTGVRQYTYPDMTILASSPQPALEVSFVLTRPTITFKALQSMTFYVPKQPTQPAPSLSSLPSQPWLMPQQQQQQTPMQYQLPSFVRQQITSPVMFSATHTKTNFERRVPVYPYSPQMELPIQQQQQQQQQQMQVQVQMQMQMQPSPSSLAGLEIPLSGLTSGSKSASASSSSSPSPSPSRMELHKSRNGFVPPPPPPQFLETKERPMPVAAHTSMPTLGSSSPSHPFLPSSSLTVSINPLPHSYQPNDAQHMEKPFVETEGRLPDCPHPEQPMIPVHTVYAGRCSFVPPPFPLSSSLPHQQQQQQQQSQLEAVSPTVQQTENAVPASVPASDEPVTADTPEIKISIYPKVSSNTSTDSVHSDESDSDSDGKSERNPRSESESNADDDRVEEEDEEEEKEEREKREKEEEEEDTPQKQESNTSKSSSPKVVVATSSSITTNPSGSHSNSRSQSPRATPPHLENDHSESSLSSSSSSSSTCSSSATTISSTGGISEEWPHVEVDIFGKDTDTQVFTDFENNSKNSSVTE